MGLNQHQGGGKGKSLGENRKGEEEASPKNRGMQEVNHFPASPRRHFQIDHGCLLGVKLKKRTKGRNTPKPRKENLFQKNQQGEPEGGHGKGWMRQWWGVKEAVRGTPNRNG